MSLLYDARFVEVSVFPRDESGARILTSSFVINDYLKSSLVANQFYIQFQIQKDVIGEANVAYLTLYNLPENYYNALSYRKTPASLTYGAEVIIKIGYTQSGLIQAFRGFVVESNTKKIPPNYITHVELRNSYYELKKRRVNLKIAKGSKKSSAILEAIDFVGGELDLEQKTKLEQILAGEFFEKDEIIDENIDTFLRRFGSDYFNTLRIRWDDTGASFDALGLSSSDIKESEIIDIDATKGEVIGSPSVTSRGFEVDMPISVTKNFNLNTIVRVNSEAITAFFIGGGIKRQNKTAVEKIWYSGDNRDGDYKTTITTKFLLDQTI